MIKLTDEQLRMVREPEPHSDLISVAPGLFNDLIDEVLALRKSVDQMELERFDLRCENSAYKHALETHGITVTSYGQARQWKGTDND